LAVVADDAGNTTEIRTFLIADVRGYTRYTQEYGDEAAAHLAARFADIVGEMVAGRDGRVVELRGDEALCVFGSPRGALRAAVDLQRRCADELRADPSVPLRVGVGIDAGEAVAVAGGYRGGALNLAARLCSIAGPGEVLVSEGIVHLARHVDEMSYVDRGRVELKGLDEPVHVMQVTFELDMPEAASVAVRRWTRGRLAAMAVGGIVLVALVALVATGGGAGHPASLGTNVVGILDASGHLVGQVPLRGRPGGVAAGAGSVWATNAESDSVVQIDPAGQVVDTIPVGVGPTGVAVGGGGVWVADSGSGAVSWINARDPSSGATRISVGQGPGPIAYGESAAWVVNATDGTLQKIDPDSLKPKGTPIAIGGAPTAVAVGGGWVWVTDTSSSSVVKIDPDTRRVVARIPVGNNPVAVAFGADRLWVANAADGTVTRIDPATDQEKQIPVGGNPSGLAYTTGVVWVSVGQPASVTRIDAASTDVTTTPVGSLPRAVAVSSDRTWVTALAAPASHRGGVLRVVGTNGWFGGNGVDRGFLPPDPGAAVLPTEWPLLSLTNDGLVTYRRVGGPAGAQVVPDLAVQLPTVSDGLRTYTFQLRAGIRYSNGTPVRASDFRYAVERQFRHDAAGLYYQELVFSTLVGFRACDKKPATCSLASAIETDDKAGTVTIHLSRPDPILPQKLATTFGALVPPGSPRPNSGRPVPATGPYMIATYSAKRGLLLTRNPYFHEWSADAQPSGYPDELRWTFVADAGAELTDVEDGTADVMLDSPPIGRLGELGTRYAGLAHPYAGLTTIFLALNTRVSPFNRLAVRRALNLAVDRNQVVKLAGGPQVAAPTCQVLPPNLPGYAPYCPYTADPTTSGLWTAPDDARAKRLVRASGTRGTPVVIWERREDPSNVAITRYLAKVLDSLGYNASVHAVSTPTYFKKVPDTRNRIQADMGGWLADYPHPLDFFDILLTCHTFVRMGNLNDSEFCNHRFDRLVNTARLAEATDQPRAVALWQAADRLAVDQAPWVALFNPLGPDVVSRRVGNYQHNSQWGILLDQLWVK